MATDFTIADVLAWARTKPADERYCYVDDGRCALAQFLQETKRVAAPSIGGNFSADGAAIYDNGGVDFRRVGYVPPKIATAAGEHPWVFGAFVKRLEALCPETIVTPSEWTKLDAYLTESVEA